VPKRSTLSNVINKCCTLSVSFYLSVWIFGIAETGIARGSPPGTTTEVQRVGFPAAEIRFVSRLVVVLAEASHHVFRSTLQGLNQSIVVLSPLSETTYSTSHEIPNDGS
jgi:hypothetical protein